jgi:hypothetical protein
MQRGQCTGVSRGGTHVPMGVYNSLRLLGPRGLSGLSGLNGLALNGLGRWLSFKKNVVGVNEIFRSIGRQKNFVCVKAMVVWLWWWSGGPDTPGRITGIVVLSTFQTQQTHAQSGYKGWWHSMVQRIMANGQRRGRFGQKIKIFLFIIFVKFVVEFRVLHGCLCCCEVVTTDAKSVSRCWLGKNFFAN